MSAVLRPVQILLVGQKIRQIRKSRHLTQADVASRIGVTQSDLSRMENGEYKVGLDTLFKILQVFELPMSRFFEEAASDAADRSVASVSPPPSHAEAVEVPSGSPADVEGCESSEGSEGSEGSEERERLFSEWSELSADAREEVMEFIAFKRMQQLAVRPQSLQNSQNPKWKSEVDEDDSSSSSSSSHAAPSGRVDRGPWGQGGVDRRKRPAGRHPEGDQNDA